jgi:hypothetical protein
MTISNSQASVESALTEFLAEQRERLSDRTFHRYQEVVQLLRHSLDRYAYTSLDADERRRWEKEFESNEESAFRRLFGPEKIPPHLGEFLDYFMVRKVFAGQELLKASGTVTGKLARGSWPTAATSTKTPPRAASDRAREAARDLPIADRLGMLLHDVTDRAPDIDPNEVGDEDWIEDYLEITDVEPGKIWLEGGVGPIAVPRKASDLARPGWSAFVTAANVAGRWHLLEVGPVYP